MLWTRWLVLLLCWGATSGEQQADERKAAPAEVRTDSRRQRSPPPVEPLDFGFVPAAVYDTHAYYEPGPIGILFHMVHAFLYVVQPNSFPKGEIIIVTLPLPIHLPLPSSSLLIPPQQGALLFLVGTNHSKEIGITRKIKSKENKYTCRK